MNEKQQALIDGIINRVSDDQLKRLIADVGDVNYKDNRMITPLVYAILNGNKSAFELLIKNKADVNLQDEQGDSPLHIAIREMRDDFVDTLFTAKADFTLQNKYGDTPLHAYAEGGPQRGASLLEKYQNAFENSIYLKNFTGETPLHCAIRSDNMYFFTFFVSSLQHRYYGQVDLKKLHGQHGDNLAHSVVRRLSRHYIDNESRTYTMLHLLAGLEPSLFDEKNNEGLLSGKTPYELLNNHTCKQIVELVKNPYVVFSETYSNKQMLGELQKTLNGLRNENEGLKKEIKNINDQLKTLTHLLKTNQENKEQEKPVVSNSLRMY